VPTDGDINFYNNLIFNMVEDFSPKIEPKEFLKFYAIPVKDNNDGIIIDKLFVFKIIIKRGDPSILYSSSSKKLNSTIRLQGQCANLTAEEICKEIIERNKKKFTRNNINNDDDFDKNQPTPTPIQQQIVNNEEKKKNNSQKKNEVKKEFNIIKEKNIKNKNEINDNVIINENENDNDNNEEKNDEENDVVGLNKNKNNEFEDYRNSNTNNKKKKNKKKNIKKNKNNTFKVEVTNIDKNVDEKVLYELFKDFNCDNMNFYKLQNGMSNGYLDFQNEEDANNCVNTFNNVSLGQKPIKLKRINFNI